MNEQAQDLCPDDMLAAALELAGRDDAGGLSRIEALLRDHPGDPRLHFLQGSLLAGKASYAEAREAMGRSIALAPDYAIARFQLGLLELSCGDAAASELTLQPLADAESEDALSLFARGLRHMARDEFAAATGFLRRGIASNQEHPLVSRDMEMIISRMGEVEAENGRKGDNSEDVSAAHLLIQRYADKTTKH
jgi:tetratricopeptide (TPR) repeat protein